MPHRPAPFPSDEEERALSLEHLGILDTVPEQGFDDIVMLASTWCEVPIALVSLVDRERQWFKACVGLDVKETHRDLAFCAHAILAPADVLVVEDATLDLRFKDSALVLGPPFIRFYAGAPVRDDKGHPLGTVCVIDTQPRTLTAAQRAALLALARQTASLLQLRLLSDQRERQAQVLERELAQANALNRLTEDSLHHARRISSLGMVTASIAHDFNNVLQALSASLQMIRLRARRPTDVERLSDAGLQAVDQGRQLVSHLLASVRQDSPNLLCVDVNAELESIRDLLSRTAADGIDLTFDLAAPNTGVMCEEGQLNAAVMNLLTNARDAMGGTGRVCISTRLVCVEDDPSLAGGEYVVLSVTDDGPGIAPELAAKIFEPFFTTKERGKGTGLGLSQVAGFAEAAGGNVRATSEPDVGTTVTVYLRALGKIDPQLCSSSDPLVVSGGIRNERPAGHSDAEAERDQATALLRMFTAAVPGVVYAKDRQGRMLVANQGTTMLIGKPPEFYLGKTDLEYLDDKAQAQVIMETDRRIMEGGLSEQVEENVRLADGSPATWLSVKTPFLDENGQVIGLIGSSIDVTARKAAEAAVQELNRTLEQRILIAVKEREDAVSALHHAQKMEAVGQLTGGIAHDFNNLLAGISGSLELMHTRLGQGLMADVDKYIGVAQGAVKRAASLTHRLLAFSRRQTLSPQPTDVNALVFGMEELVARSVGPAIQLTISAASKVWATLIDSAQLENSLLNLCLNARDAMPEGGEIVIRTSNVWLDATADVDHERVAGHYLSICISDTGTGMSSSVMARAIEPFFTTKPVGAGTGLGLSMVYGFARQSGGDIQISSQQGAGTTVCLYLPRHECPVAPVNEQQAPAPLVHGCGETVLVVDDEPSVRMLLVEWLGGLGYRVIEAADGAAGLRLLHSDTPIDLLISDVGLPGGINGRQMVTAARAHRATLPVLFITGYAENSLLENCHLEPLTQVLTKPFKMDALTVRVMKLIDVSK